MTKRRRRPKSLVQQLPKLVDEALFVVGAVAVIGFSICASDFIMTRVVKFCEWSSGDKLPAWFHLILLCILAVVLILFAMFIAYMHIMGMKMPNEKEEEKDQQELPFPEIGKEESKDQ